LETVVEAIADTHGGDNDVVELKVEFEASALLREVIPSAGLPFEDGHDNLALEAAKQTISADLFQEVGIYFQNRVLPYLAKALASTTPRMTSSVETLRTLLRVPQRAGAANIYCTAIRTVSVSSSSSTSSSSSSSSSVAQSSKMVSLSPLRDAALQLVKVLLADMPHIHPNDPVLAATFAAPKNARKTGGSVPAAAAAAPPAPVSATATPSSSAKSAPADSSSSSGAGSGKKRGRSPAPDHPSADGGFVKRSSSRLGAASSSPSKTRGGAAAARARKEDGEEEEGDDDGDEEEDKEEEDDDDDDEEDTAWTTDHVHVTNRAEIAKYFGGKKCPQVLFVGHVVMYAPPSRQGAGDQLYKIQYEDDDTEDFDEKELKRAMALYHDLVRNGETEI